MIQLPPQYTRVALLTTREYEILLKMGEGIRTSRIAADLKISTRTVSAHYGNMIRKLDLKGGTHEMRVLAISYHLWVQEHGVRRLYRGLFSKEPMPVT